MTSFAAPSARAATDGHGGFADHAGASTYGRPDTTGPSGFARLLGVLFWILLPALAITGIVLAAVTWASKANTAPPGIPGVYQVEQRSCGGAFCLETGTFTSNDGHLVLSPLTGYSGWEAGSRHNVVYDPSNSEQIVPLRRHWDPTPAVVALAGAFGVLAVWGWFAFGARRTPHPGPALA